jgi:hypothetical protein
MTWTSIWNGIASFFEAMFRIWKALGQKPNIIIGTIIFCCLVYWALQMIKQNKEAKQNGTYP